LPEEVGKWGNQGKKKEGPGPLSMKIPARLAGGERMKKESERAWGSRNGMSY